MLFYKVYVTAFAELFTCLPDYQITRSLDCLFYCIEYQAFIKFLKLFCIFIL